MSGWDRQRAKKVGRLAPAPGELADAMEAYRAEVASALEREAAAEAELVERQGEQLELFG